MLLQINKKKINTLVEILAKDMNEYSQWFPLPPGVHSKTPSGCLKPWNFHLFT